MTLVALSDIICQYANGELSCRREKGVFSKDLQKAYLHACISAYMYMCMNVLYTRVPVVVSGPQARR